MTVKSATAAVVLAWSLMAPGCASSAHTHRTSSGETVLVRGPVRFQVPTQGFAIVEEHDGAGRADPHVFATNDALGLAMSATLEAAHPGDCRDHYWRALEEQPNFEPEDVTQRLLGRFQVVEYTLRRASSPRLRDLRIDQRNVIGCLTAGDATAFLHVSKVRYAPPDESLLATAFEQARLDSD